MQGHNTPTKPCVWACSQLCVFWSTLDRSRVLEAPGTLLACGGRFHRAWQRGKAAQPYGGSDTGAGGSLSRRASVCTLK